MQVGKLRPRKAVRPRTQAGAVAGSESRPRSSTRTAGGLALGVLEDSEACVRVCDFQFQPQALQPHVEVDEISPRRADTTSHGKGPEWRGGGCGASVLPFRAAEGAFPAAGHTCLLI